MKALGLTLLLLSMGCQPQDQHGSLLIHAPSSGNFEIFKIIGDLTFQFVSEKLGNFNQLMSLKPGSYLVLADCSHQSVIIHPNKITEIHAHEVQFIPPLQPHKKDIFSVQCSRYKKTQRRQSMINRFNLHILPGTQDLLVGMQPLRIKIDDNEKSNIFRYKLGALRVLSPSEKNIDNTPYFISPNVSMISITQAQTCGAWQFLLPGQFQISLNGTSQTQTLAEDQKISITPSLLRLTVPKGTSLETITTIQSEPNTFAINGLKNLQFEETYPILPGPVNLQIAGSSKPLSFNILPGQHKELALKSVTVNLGCAINEWECLGKREVMLYLNNKVYPFYSSLSDMPILYFDGHISVSIEGARGLRYMLNDKHQNHTLEVGKVTFRPKYTYRPGFSTDVVRLEAKKLPHLGYSHDIVSDQDTTMTLITGSYTLARYTSVAGLESDRSKSQTTVTVRAGEKIIVSFPYYVSENRFHYLSKKKKRQSKKKRPFLDENRLFPLELF